MPLAAWCSRCGMYQWVRSDGRCVRGHAAENLSHQHEVPYEGYAAGAVPAHEPVLEPAAPSPAMPAQTFSAPPATPRQRWLLVLPILAVVLGAAAAVLFVIDLSTLYPRGLGTPAPSIVPPSSTSAGTTTTPDDSTNATDTTAAAPTPRHAATSKQPNLPAPALDAFIAWQYPGYRVARRVSFPDQYTPGRLGVNYLLVNKKEPRFRLVVGVAELKPTEDVDVVDTAYIAEVGRVLTTDEVFSEQATRFGTALTVAGQDALAKAIADKNPTSDAVYGRATIADLDVGGVAETGPSAMEFMMQDSSLGGGYQFDATMPQTPGSAAVRVQITKN